MASSPSDIVIISNGSLALTFSTTTGSLSRIMLLNEEAAVDLHGDVQIAVHTAGTLEYEPTSSMNNEYGNSRRSELPRTVQSYRRTRDGETISIWFEYVGGDWIVTARYLLYENSTVFGVDLSAEYTGDEDTTLDSLEWSSPKFDISTNESPLWAPGRTGRDWGGAYFNVHCLERGAMLTTWREAEGYTAHATLREDRLVVRLYSSGRARRGTVLGGRGMLVSVSASTDIREVRRVREFRTRRGLSAAGDRPEWARSPHIFETFVGSWPMEGDGREYAPHPRVSDLVSDLDRIKALGFDTIYLMPRHPYPSYSTASFTDLGLQYGDGPGSSDAVIGLIEAAHERGMKLILDIILHGVLDQWAISQQRDRRTHYARELEHIDSERRDAEVVAGQLFAVWTSYERAHETAWIREAPETHEFWAEHPEWFTRRKDGECQCTYTRAFDLRSPSFQEFLASEMYRCVAEFGVDGFRFDAPFWTWKQADWEEDDGYPAGWSSGGAIELLAMTRARILQDFPEIVFYAETMDSNLNKGVHLQYTYDTYFGVIDALGREQIDAETAQARMGFIRLNRLPGIVDVNTVDSHDTCWWWSIGKKWGRERFGVERTRALYSLVTLMDGGVQMYAGGDQGLTQWIAGLLRARRGMPVLARGSCDIGTVRSGHPDTFAVLREGERQWLVALVSFASEPVTARVVIPGRLSHSDPPELWDLASDETNEPRQAVASHAGGEDGYSAEIPPFGTVILGERSLLESFAKLVTAPVAVNPAGGVAGGH